MCPDFSAAVQRRRCLHRPLAFVAAVGDGGAVIVEAVAGGNVAGFIAHEHISPRPRRLHVQVRHLLTAFVMARDAGARPTVHVVGREGVVIGWNVRVGVTLGPRIVRVGASIEPKRASLGILTLEERMRVDTESDAFNSTSMSLVNWERESPELGASFAWSDRMPCVSLV